MSIRSKPSTKEYKEGYDRIFGNTGPGKGCEKCNGTGKASKPDVYGNWACPVCVKTVSDMSGGR